MYLHDFQITFWGLIVVGGLAICSGCLNLLLPETLNKKLPESLEHLKRFVAHLNVITICSYHDCRP